MPEDTCGGSGASSGSHMAERKEEGRYKLSSGGGEAGTLQDKEAQPGREQVTSRAMVDMGLFLRKRWTKGNPLGRQFG
ncbi:hypothetical protein NDU88_004508 [Pleurodeles waltl]|uniref:Uncharacterized protein n=1 Tax=Pleurodeles waltl TaxID=8319 RepID=A0AAV7V5F1_PLEWA|nr:hypothetical protein NDU88_004508 [Pleurodeles waltl]